MMRKHRFPYLFLLWFVLALACRFSEDTGAETTIPAGIERVASPAAAEVIPATAPAEANVAPVDELLDSLPRTFHYAGVVFTVSDGRLTNRSPVDPNVAQAERRVELIVEGKNQSGFKAEILNGALRLAFADGTVVEQIAIDPLEIGEARTFNLRGDVGPATTWEGATLTLSEPGREPLSIALTGSESVTGQPWPLTGGEGVGTNKYGEMIQYQIVEASLWLDGPQPGGYFVHAPAGQQFLKITVHATNSGGAHGVSIYSEQFQAVAGGVIGAVSYDVDGAQSVTLNGSVDVSYYFLVPAGVATLALNVAADGQGPATISLAQP